MTSRRKPQKGQLTTIEKLYVLTLVLIAGMMNITLPLGLIA